MAPGADELRHQLRELCARRARGDLREHDFERRQTDGSVVLSRAVVAERLAPDETIVAEHHLVHSHFKLARSMLQEPEQTTVSFFATEHRVIRMRGSLLPGRPVSCDQADGSRLDELPYGAIRRVARHSERRWGEVAAGLTAAALAFLLGRRLAVTGPLLLLLGLAGALHGLLAPTRWVELVADGAEVPFAIAGLRRRSGRRLLAVIRRALSTPDRGPPAAPEAGGPP